jgi:hypothetical protein
MEEPMTTKLTGRGGPGRGQGKKKVVPLDAKSRHLRLTEEEYAKVKAYIQKLRSEQNG